MNHSKFRQDSTAVVYAMRQSSATPAKLSIPEDQKEQAKLISEDYSTLAKCCEAHTRLIVSELTKQSLVPKSSLGLAPSLSEP